MHHAFLKKFFKTFKIAGENAGRKHMKLIKGNRLIHALIAFAPPVVTSNKHNVDTFNKDFHHGSVYPSSEYVHSSS